MPLPACSRVQMRDTQRQGVPSRGALPVDFVSSEAAPEEYLAGLDAKVGLRHLSCHN